MGIHRADGDRLGLLAVLAQVVSVDRHREAEPDDKKQEGQE
jgi:hypothetical protein